jgi:hypothetical protein
MKFSSSKILDKKNKQNYDFVITNKNFKTTDINILLNRVSIEKKKQSKKKILFSISIITILFLLSFVVLSN